MDKAQLISELQTILTAEVSQLLENLQNGDRAKAHRKVDSIIDGLRELEDNLGGEVKFELGS